jgi:hypothetical protein
MPRIASTWQGGGAQAIGADDIDLRFGFVGRAAFNNFRKAGARHAAEIAPGHDHEVRVESLFGIHRRTGEIAPHLRFVKNGSRVFED